MIAGRDDLVAIDADPDVDYHPWLASRALGIGGSDAPAVLGEDEYRRPIDVFWEKTDGKPDGDSERSRGGRWLEPKVREAFERGGDEWPRGNDGLVVVRPPSVYDATNEWIRGSTDGLVYREETVAMLPVGTPLYRFAPHAALEIKTHGWFGSRGYNLSDEGDPIISVPPSKRIQCAWYMALYRVAVCYLAALVDTHIRRTFVLQRDRALEDMILEETDRFWRKHVVARVPPDPDGTSSYREYLSQRFKLHGPDMIESTTAVDAAVAELLPIKRRMTKDKREREALEQMIKAHIGANLGVMSASGKLTWSWQPSGKFRESEARAELYTALGWTDHEITAFETRHQQPGHRVLRTPK